MMATQQLRELLNRSGSIRTFAAHDAFSAKVMEAAGIEMLFLGGFGISASKLGLPDLGFITQTEMASAIRDICSQLNIPVVADGDTGYGELENVARTVQEFEQAGAAGILLEDQVFPKRCGHFEGKAVISVEEMLPKLQVALDSRSSPDFAIFARTDARATEGLESAIERITRYGELGADVCFLEAPQSVEELERIAQEVNFPLIANMLVGGVTPILSAQELEQMGYKIIVDPVSSLAATGHVIQNLVKTMQQKGRIDHLSNEMMTFQNVKEILGVNKFLDKQ